jgi:hypothetical protein
MNASDYYELFRYLMEKHGLLEENILYVKNIADWCRKYNIPEPDTERPFKLISDEVYGCKMLIREDIPDSVIRERINAMRIRGQLQNVAFDRADMLDTPHRKLAYLFLSEYATSISDINDALSADNWAFAEMEKLGFYQEFNATIKRR